MGQHTPLKENCIVKFAFLTRIWPARLKRSPHMYFDLKLIKYEENNINDVIF